MTPKQREALEAVKAHGSIRAAARALNKSSSNVHSLYHQAMRYEALDPSIQVAMAAVGMRDAGALHSGWVKTKEASLYFQVPQSGQNVSDVVREAFEGITPCPSIPAPEKVSGDLLTTYPLFDCHIGMKAWGKETGEDYDTDIAEQRIKDGISRCVAASPASQEALIVIGGDLLHANDSTNMTPASRHILDVDTRHDRTIDIAIRTMAAAIEMAAQKHGSVTVAVIPGNHDRDAYLAVMFALRERYRLNDRIKVQRQPGDFFVMEWGLVMIAAHHGDKAKAERLVMHMADEWPEMWGRTRHRHYYTGHVHHAKLLDVGGVQVEQFRAITPRDAYAASHAYSAKSDMQAITYSKTGGEISRIRVALGAEAA